tara:strand:- start:727 stop:990 length:264 start_codon:yes stop_codon:yes gene_type:complete
MVWVNKIISLLFLLNFLFVSNNTYSTELNKDDKMYFNFIDLNNDNQISLHEIEKSTSIIFQIIDFNQDGFISKSEISELKNIIDSLR